MGKHARLKKVAAALCPYLERICREMEEKKAKVGRKGFSLYSKLLVLFSKRMLGIKTDVEMERKLRESSALRAICKLRKAMDNTTISKARKKIGILKLMEIFYQLVLECKRVGLIKGRLIAVDPTEFDAYYKRDPCARAGWCETKGTFFFGYKVHLAADVEAELPVAFLVKPGNEHEASVFDELLEEIMKFFTYEIEKILGDAAFDAAEIRQKLRDMNIADVIARNGRGYFRSEKPKDKDYNKRTGIERVHSRMKELLGLDNFRLNGLWGATFHVLTVLCSMLFSALGSFLAGYKNYRSIALLRY